MKSLKSARILVILALILLVLVPRTTPAHAGSPPNRLDDNTGLTSEISLAGDVCDYLLGVFSVGGLIGCPSFDGRVVGNPHIWNIFADGNWDGDNPATFSEGAINNATKAIVDGSPGNNYLGPASQYRVGAASFSGSSTNNGCTGAPSGTTNQISIELWVTCEVEAPGTGVPYPDDNTLYVVYLPPSVDINNGPLGGTCDKFSAYHLQSMALEVDFDLFVPVPHFQSYPYVVIPLKCANQAKDMNGNLLSPADGLTVLMSHELIEAATDPIGPHGWIDDSTVDLSLDFLKYGEAADICQNGGPVPTSFRRLDNGTMVAPYWSNSDNACVPLVHTLTLKTVGLPTAGHASVRSVSLYNDNAFHDVDLSTQSTFSVPDGTHISWSFPSPVMGAPGVRYVTGVSEQDDVPMTSDVISTALYGTQYFLTVNTSPDSVAAIDPSLTPSQWVPEGQSVALNTDNFIPTGVDRYRFEWWTGDISSIFNATSIVMDGPKTATAAYVLQHQVTFDQTGIPAGVPWTVIVDGVTQTGPFSDWYDEFSYVDFSYQDPVPDLTPGTQYKLVSVSAAAPLFVTATGPVTATFKTQHLLTVNTSGLTSPNLTHISNSGTVLGTANDSTPLAVWIDHGTALALAGDDDVDGVDGTQYFPQSFSPAPPATMAGPVTTTLTYETLTQLINDALAGGGIAGPGADGLTNSFRQQVAAFQADLKAHDWTQALADLQSFISHSQAQCCQPQSGKELATATAMTFEYDASLVYHSALCKALAAGQVTLAQESADYTYYNNLVTGLGKTPLPPC